MLCRPEIGLSVLLSALVGYPANLSTHFSRFCEMVSENDFRQLEILPPMGIASRVQGLFDPRSNKSRPDILPVQFMVRILDY